MKRRYAVLDVFADRPLAGNPLAVVLDTEDLDEARMQAIAAEFNLSETVFVGPAERQPVHSAGIRIFTPRRELPFAGHPTIGTAILLAIESAGGDYANHDAVLVLEEEIGPIRCGVNLRGPDAGHCTFDLPHLPEEKPLQGDHGLIAAALDLAPNEIGFENHEPSRFDAGVPYTFVPVRDLGAIGRARPQVHLFEEAFGGDPLTHVYVYTRETNAAEHSFHARMFAPGSGIAEDPATGSAVAALTGVIARFDQPIGGGHRYVIEQGSEMGRPSLIGLEIDMEGGAIQAARLSGDAVAIARGTLSL